MFKFKKKKSKTKIHIIRHRAKQDFLHAFRNCVAITCDPVGAGRPYRGLASLNSCISQLADARSHVPRSRPRIRQNQSFLTRTKPPRISNRVEPHVYNVWMEREGNGGKREETDLRRERGRGAEVVREGPVERDSHTENGAPMSPPMIRYRPRPPPGIVFFFIHRFDGRPDGRKKVT